MSKTHKREYLGCDVVIKNDSGSHWFISVNGETGDWSWFAQPHLPKSCGPRFTMKEAIKLAVKLYNLNQLNNKLSNETE